MIEGADRRRPSGAAAYVLLTVALSWPVWIMTWLAVGRPSTLTTSNAMIAGVYAGSFAPGAAAAILLRMAGRGALWKWLLGFVRFRCGWRAYAAALLPLPLTLLLLTFLLGYTPRLDKGHGMPALFFYLTIFPISLFNGFMNVILGAGPLGEEGGWRGYLLPRLLETRGETGASIIIGVIWALWHLPIMAMFADWRGGVALAVYLPLYMSGVIGLSFVMSRVWLIAGGSLIPCIWFHGLINAVGSMAFDRDLWASHWSAEVSTAHFALASLIVGVLLNVATHTNK